MNQRLPRNVPLKMHKRSRRQRLERIFIDNIFSLYFIQSFLKYYPWKDLWDNWEKLVTILLPMIPNNFAEVSKSLIQQLLLLFCKEKSYRLDIKAKKSRWEDFEEEEDEKSKQQVRILLCPLRIQQMVSLWMLLRRSFGVGILTLKSPFFDFINILIIIMKI